MPSLPRFVVVAACVLGGAIASAAPAGAVVGGEPVDPATVPWFVPIGSCGGTLVAPGRVLTAAHCVFRTTPADYPTIMVGTQARRATGIALHPGWRQRNGDNFLDDVAVVALDAPVAGVPIVALGDGTETGLAHLLGSGRPFAPGTGHSEAEQYAPGGLRTADLAIVGDAACAAAFKTYRNPTGEKFAPRMLCASDADGREPLSSGCFGDSGGPLWQGTATAPVQLGVVSWGGNCGADHRPSVFADVARYRAFIADPAPTWAPTRKGDGAARIAGTARPGRTLTCSAPGYVPEPGAKLAYTWSSAGAFAGGRYQPPRDLRAGKTYKIARRDAGRRIACHVDAANDGGAVAVGAATRLVRR